jgi:hypothetical protein
MAIRDAGPPDFLPCFTGALAKQKQLSNAERLELEQRLVEPIDLTELAKHVDEETPSRTIASLVASCASSETRFTFSGSGSGSGLGLSAMGTGRPLEIAVRPDSEDVAVAYAPRLAALGTAGGSAGATLPSGLPLPPLLEELSRALRKQEEKIVTFLLQRGAGRPLAGASLSLRVAGGRARNDGCHAAGREPVPASQLWNGARDECLEAISDDSGSARFFHDAPLTGYKLVVREASSGLTVVRTSKPRELLGARIEIDITESDAAAWDQPPPKLPDCGGRRELTALLELVDPNLPATLEDASFWIDRDGSLNDPISVPLVTWQELRHYRLQAPAGCKPCRVFVRGDGT